MYSKSLTVTDEAYAVASHTQECIEFSHFLLFPFRFRGVHHAFAKILAEGGIRGLWAGWVPNIQRAALVNMGGNGDFIEF